MGHMGLPETSKPEIGEDFSFQYRTIFSVCFLFRCFLFFFLPCLDSSRTIFFFFANCRTLFNGHCVSPISLDKSVLRWYGKFGVNSHTILKRICLGILVTHTDC